MYKEKILLLIIMGFGAGILFRSFFVFSYAHALLVGVCALFCLLFFLMRKKELFAAIGIFFIAASFGIARFEMKDEGGVPKEVQLLFGQTVKIKAWVSDETDERENYVRIVAQATHFFNWELKDWQEISEFKLLLLSPRFPELRYGDAIEIQGKLRAPENISEFDWKAYLAKDEIYAEIAYPRIAILQEQKGSAIKRALFSLKEKYQESIGRLLPEPHASFLAGLTVGARRSMPENILSDFRKTGVMHIVVLSGYNISLIANAFARFFALLLPWVFGMMSAGVGIVLFALLAGASATVVRASVMALLVIAAQMTGRISRVTIALLVAGAFMLLLNPKLLRFDPSFQLSFLATLGLIYFSPFFKKYFMQLPKRFDIREIAAATVATQIAVLPLLLSMAGGFSLVALPANILVLISVPYAMLFGFLAGAVGLLFPLLAFPFSWVAYGLLSYELFVVSLFANFPFASLSLF